MAKKVKDTAAVYDEIIRRYNETADGQDSPLGDGYSDHHTLIAEVLAEEAEIPGVEYLDAVGGGEGGGEYVHLIFSLDGKAYKLGASYYSYDGITWDADELYEVTPRQKTVTVWE